MSTSMLGCCQDHVPTAPARAATREVVEREAKPAPERKREAAAPERSSQYRLVYDKELSRIFIQVFDQESGGEIMRFPSEELVQFVDKSIGRRLAGVSPRFAGRTFRLNRNSPDDSQNRP